MTMPSDIDIAQRARPKLITEIAKVAGIRNEELKLYGNHMAKVCLTLLNRLKNKPNGKLILVTSINPTKFGEGKTTTAIGLTQAFAKLKKRVMLCLREPSLGPIFGTKGGACGGGYSQVIPMEDINLHFTGDTYAVSAANNLLCAMMDNHIYFDNRLHLDHDNVFIKRTSEIGDRTLRRVKFRIKEEFLYNSGFDITAASEIMAILALSRDRNDLKRRLSRIIVGFNTDRKPITSEALKAVGAMGMILKDAIMPNLVQTIEGNPVFVHCGPFANIAHGANSLVSILMALKLADYVISESGFGSDLGAEKFFNIVCRQGGLKADIAVIVVSVRAIKVHGLENLTRHIEIVKKFGVRPVVALNKFSGDTQKELDSIEKHCSLLDVDFSVSEAVAKGGNGAKGLVDICIRLLQQGGPDFSLLYEDELPVKEKITRIATQVYKANGVDFSRTAEEELEWIEELGLGRLPINIAKTQFSLSDNHKLKGVPKGWRLKVKDMRIFAGAGFIVPVAGDIMLMPGLPASPAACNIDIDEHGKIKGLS